MSGTKRLPLIFFTVVISLVQALMSPNYKTVGTKGLGVTDGIDIATWQKMRGNDKVTYSIWDFAGQTVYYNTHQVWISL